MSTSKPAGRRNTVKRGTRSRAQERRAHRRFPLHYPASLRISGASSSRELQSISQDISVQGILLATDSRLPQPCRVSFTITVQEEYIVRPIELAGEGEVVRVEPHRRGTGFSIAVKCSRPIFELTGPSGTHRQEN